MNEELLKFSESILNTLKSNGFPGKRVSLPTDKMYETADTKGLSLNSVLDQLRSEHNIESQIGADKIIFSQPAHDSPAAGMNPQDILKQAQEMMSKMNPEELERIQQMFTNMSSEEKEEILKKGKDLGIL